MVVLSVLLALSFGHFVAGYVDSSGYESFGGSKSSYLLHRERVPWDTANRICTLEGGHLVVIDTDDEIHVVNLLFGRVPFFSPPMAWGFDLMHVGITDKAKEGEWLTVLGGPVSKTGYNKWRATEPNNYMNEEHCGAIGRAGSYCDLKCSGDVGHLCPFVCEKEISDEEFIDIRGSKDQTEQSITAA